MCMEIETGRCRHFQQGNNRLVWNQCREAASFIRDQPSFYPSKLVGSASVSATPFGKSWVDVSPIPSRGDDVFPIPPRGDAAVYSCETVDHHSCHCRHKAKFHYAIWLEAGSKQVRSWSQTGSKLVRTCLRPASNLSATRIA